MLSSIKTVPISEDLIPTFLSVLVISEGILSIDRGCNPLESIK